MNLEPAPRLSKSIFLTIDAFLLLAAFVIVFFNDKNPYAPLPFISAVICVVLAALVGLIPFLIDYAADSAEYVQQERLRINEQIQRLQAAGESLARAAAQIKAVEEAVHKSAHAAENLPYRMQEKLAEFNEALAEKETADHEALEQELVELRAANSDRLHAVAEKIAQTTAELAALEISTRRQLTAAEVAATKVQQTTIAAADKLEARLQRILATLDGKPSAAVATTPGALDSARRNDLLPPADSAQESPRQATETTASEPVKATPPPDEPITPSDEETKSKKARGPRKPKPEETLVALSAPAATSPTTASAESDSPADEPELVAGTTEEPTEAAASTDGATRLLATAYIGIGNKLYIRGEGPGLNWDKGVPMQFVSIGKWGWATHDATTPVRCALYKNDDSVALTGEISLAPGKHVEVTALF